METGTPASPGRRPHTGIICFGLLPYISYSLRPHPLHVSSPHPSPPAPTKAGNPYATDALRGRSGLLGLLLVVVVVVLVFVGFRSSDLPCSTS
ncbi:hypothetical protein BHM03_00013400 [Ensete ventricosum]|nr:hypothetical protein BHM03_00013400 [Ensete ventricosum]